MEKPELEVRRTELLRQEEDLKIQLVTLEEQLLTTLAESQGNILENKVYHNNVCVYKTLGFMLMFIKK